MHSNLDAAFRLPATDVIKALGADAQHGLTEEEARARLARDGPNELAAEPPVSSWRNFFAQFQDILVILLLIATAVSGANWLYERESSLPYEAIAIFAVVLLNAVIGFIQEERAEAAVAALRAHSAEDASLIRGGKRKRVPASEVVVGDTVLVEEGDTIPADARVVESTALQTGEAMLTGESLPVTKDADPIADDVALGDRANMLFSHTAVTYGRGTAVVIATGMRTEIGHIASLLHETTAERTPLQRELDRTSKVLGLIVVAIAIVMVVTIIFVDDIHGFRALLAVLILGVALAVAAMPEGLPAIVTAVLSIGVRRMAKRNAIVRHLAAVETLGSASVIASDKTGTLTKNEMTVRVVITASGRVNVTGSGYAPNGFVQREGGGDLDGPLRTEVERALAAADRANNAVVREEGGRWVVEGDPTEGALIVAARKCGLDPDVLAARLPRVGEVPFSSERKLMTTVHRDARATERIIAFTKGAPGVLLSRCNRELVGENTRPLTADRRAEIERTVESLGDRALRTLGVASRYHPAPAPNALGETVDASIEKDLVFAGLIGMIDPPRDEARGAVARAKGAGIRPIMITGDHPRTASVIARELGLTSDARVLVGSDLDRLNDEELVRSIAETSVYARVNPEHKLRIVKALQRNGDTVAMTGDGVNDAPALKTADIGVAMGISGTDVSKEAADIILADDNFATIVAAVEEGRAIFAHIRKFLFYLLSSNIGEVLTMFFGVVLGNRLGLPAQPGTIASPLLATQILWINLVTDGAPALALGVDPADPGLMAHHPRPRHEDVITRRMWRNIFIIGGVIAMSTLFVLDASLPGGVVRGSHDLRYAQTMAFTTLVVAQLMNVFNARSDERSVFVGLFTNRWLWGAVALSLALQMLVLYVPAMQPAFGTVGLNIGDWVRCTVAASMVVWVSELLKIVERPRRSSRST